MAGKTLPLIYTDNTDEEKDRVIPRDRAIEKAKGYGSR